MPRFWHRFGLRWQTILLLTTGLIFIFGLFGYVASRTLTQSTDAALEESLSQAEVVADSIDSLITHVRQQMAALALRPGITGSIQVRESTVLDAFEVMASVESLWLLDGDGNVVSHRSGGSSPDQVRLSYVDLVRETLETGVGNVVRPAVDNGGGLSVAAISAPVFGAGGEPVGVIVGEVHLTRQGTPLVPLPDEDSTKSFSVIDGTGNLIASTEGVDPRADDHLALLLPYIRDGVPGVEQHNSETVGDHVVAFAPLETMGGGIIFEEHSDLVLGIPQHLRRTLLVLGFVAMVLAAAVAWMYVRRMVQPVLALREATDRIAGGGLDEPINVDRHDELGDLARGFESMRVRLLESEMRRRNWEQELEERVRVQAAQVRALLDRVISAQEAERKRVARELHDGAAQMVSALLLQVEGMAAALPPDSPASRDLAPSARSYAVEALEEMRRLVLDLRPMALDDLGLVAALREYADQRLAKAGIDVSLRPTDGPLRLGSSLETAVFRIVQEAINNVANHSEASKASISIESRPTTLRAMVSDNGKGFVLEEALRSGPGVGIAGMLERAEILGGHLSVLSTPGEGTRITLEVPLEPE